MSIESITLWHKRARPTPTDADFNTQLGCHFEEFAEMVHELTSEDPKIREALNMVHLFCGRLGDALKAGTGEVYIKDPVAFLDSLGDQVVTAVGTGHCAGMKVPEAIRRVDRSNWSKFDSDGMPIFSPGGKIKKGPNYAAPYLTDLV